MSRLAFQAYLASCKSFEKLKISFGRDPKLKFAWGEEASEIEAYQQGPRPVLGAQPIRRQRKGNIVNICGDLWCPQQRGGRGRKRKEKKSKEPQKRIRKYWPTRAVSAQGRIRTLKYSRVVSRTFYRSSLASELRVISLMFIIGEMY